MRAGRILFPFLVLLILAMIVAPSAWSATYYVSSAGSDSNAGTSTGTAWAHAPYMTGATGNPLAYVCHAGDTFILRGGETWTTASLPWTWNCSGTVGNVNLIGGDGSWYNATNCSNAGYSGYCRPILNAGGKSTTCVFNAGGTFGAILSNGYPNYVEFRYLEFTGGCTASSGNTSAYYLFAGNSANHISIHDSYFHGWDSVGTRSAFNCFAGPTGSGSDAVAYNNVVDGTVDGETDGAMNCSMNGAWSEFHHNYASNQADFINTNYIKSFHHNTFKLFTSAHDTSEHGNMFENNSSSPTGSLVYNNVFIPHNPVIATNAIVMWNAPQLGQTDYVFNNVIYDVPQAGDNTLMCEKSLVNPGGSCVFFNNTIQCGTDASATKICGSQDLQVSGTTKAENNHFITSVASCATAAISVHSGNAINYVTNTCMTPATATSQGYTSAETYAFSPTLITNSTVGAGTNFNCSTIPDASAATACQSDTSYGVGYDATNHVVTNPKTPSARPTSGAWDTGAYEFTGAAAPLLSFSPSPAAFGNQLVASTSGPLTITVSNIGTASQILSTPFFTIGGTNPTNFANAGTGTCVNGGTIPASASCTIKLTFTPSTTGARSATLTINGTVFGTDALTGTGTQPALSFSPSPGAFGNQNVSTTSSPLTITVSNTGTASQVLSTPYFTITGTNASNFANAGTGSCANGGTIAASSSCTVNLTFTPSALGARAATLTINGTVSGTDSLTGTGLQAQVSLSPTSIAFGNQATGTSSGNRLVTLTNPGNATLTIASITLTGANAAEFSTNGSTCSSTLAALASCSINVVFSPTTATAKNANLTFATSASTSPDNVALTGTGVTPATPALSFSPSPAAFGNQRTATTSAPLTITVTNTGNASEILSTPYFTLSGPNSTSFANAGTGTCASGGTIAASGTCTINLTFTPSTTGALNGILTVNGTVSAQDLLTGTGVTPVISMSPSPAAFGNQSVSTTSSPLTVTVSNTGTSSETLSTPYFTITGTNSSNYANAGTGTCTNGGTIAASGSCTINLTFTPSASGSRTATLTLQGTVNATDSLTGTGVAAVVGLAPTSIAFGNQNTGTSSSNSAVTLTNTGNTTLNISSIALSGADSGQFSTNGSTCGSTLAASAACSINVVFAPTTTGAKSANLTFTTDAASSPNNVALTGTGVSSGTPSLSFSPSPLAFGNQPTGTTSSPLTLTVTNNGTATQVLSTPYFTLGGSNPTVFANTGGGTCVDGASITVSGSCTILLTFTPSSVAAFSATITINGTVSASNALTGTGGTLPTITLTPINIAFGNQDNGTSSNPTSVTLTNSGGATLTITSIAVTGADSSQFSINTNTCGSTLASLGTCSWNVVFSPTTTGGKSASVTVTTSAASSPDAVTLTGTGRVPTPPATTAPAITVVSVLPPGSVLIAGSAGISPRNVLVSATGCSSDGLNYSTPCRFSITCGNCNQRTRVWFNGTQVQTSYSRGVITASVPVSLIPMPNVSTDYAFSLLN